MDKPILLIASMRRAYYWFKLSAPQSHQQNLLYCVKNFN